jgi:hypothetical protein
MLGHYRTSGFVWVHGQEDDAAFCETPELQAWLLELADEGPLPDPETFWVDIPALPRVPKEALKALFQDGNGRQDYCRVDGTWDWAAIWDGTVIKHVAVGCYVEKAVRGRWGMLNGRLLEALMVNRTTS